MEPLFQTPLPFGAHGMGISDGPPGGGGVRGGPEVAQHLWLKTIPRDAQIMLSHVSWGALLLEKDGR